MRWCRAASPCSSSQSQSQHWAEQGQPKTLSEQEGEWIWVLQDWRLNAGVLTPIPKLGKPSDLALYVASWATELRPVGSVLPVLSGWSSDNIRRIRSSARRLDRAEKEYSLPHLPQTSAVAKDSKVGEWTELTIWDLPLSHLHLRTLRCSLLGGTRAGKWTSERIWLQLMARATVQKTRE